MNIIYHLLVICLTKNENSSGLLRQRLNHSRQWLTGGFENVDSFKYLHFNFDVLRYTFS